MSWVSPGSALVTCVLADFIVTYSLIQPTIIRITDFASSNLCMKLTIPALLSLFLSGDEGEDAEKNKSSQAKEEETQTESSWAAKSCTHFWTQTATPSFLPNPWGLGPWLELACCIFMTMNKHKILYCHHPTISKSSLWQPQCSLPFCIWVCSKFLKKPPFLAAFPSWLLIRDWMWCSANAPWCQQSKTSPV